LKGGDGAWQEIRGEMPMLCHCAFFHIEPTEDDDSNHVRVAILGGVDLANKMSTAITNITIFPEYATYKVT